MRRIWQFVKTTVLGGAIFLLPIAATIVILVKAGKMAVDAATPLAEKLPFPKGQAVLAVYVIAELWRSRLYLSRPGSSLAPCRPKLVRHRFSKTEF